MLQQEENSSADVQREKTNFAHVQRGIIRARLGRCLRRRSLFFAGT
jgi:hypothetical protein